MVFQKPDFPALNISGLRPKQDELIHILKPDFDHA